MTGPDKLMARQAEGCLAGIVPGVSRLTAAELPTRPFGWQAGWPRHLSEAVPLVAFHLNPGPKR